MFEEEIATRLSYLRVQKGVSAREMSLAIGQNESYINNIETGKAMPSMSALLFICDYLNILPKDFFDMESPAPAKLQSLIDKMKRLTPAQLDHISVLIDDILE